MFGPFFRDFGEDPFFASANQLMHQMDSMMNSMMQDPFRMMAAPTMHQHQHQRIMPPQHHHHHQQNHSSMLMPFGGMMGGGFPMGDPFGMPGMGQMFQGFSQQGFGAGPMFSSSSVMTMTTGPDGQPQVYQASTTTRTAPGGVREVHRSVSDSRSGVRKMAVGRHLGERGHVVEKEQNYLTGDAEEKEDFINMDEEDAQQFDEEWKQRTARSHGRPRLEMSRSRLPSDIAGPLAITAGPSHDSAPRSRHTTHPRGTGPDRHSRRRDGHRSGQNRHETSM